MTVGWGVDATKSGSVVTSGTLASDVRKVWGALYTAGIISGCTVTTSSSQMSYTVASGVVAIQTAVGEVVMAPVQGTTVPTGAAPGSGSRVDVVFVQQRFPSDGDSYVSVRVLPFANEAAVVLPPNSQELNRYLVSAGQTNTNAAVFIGNIDYSIPYSSGLGVLHNYVDTYEGPLPVDGTTRKGAGSIYLPTDRRLKISVQSTLYAIGAVGFDNSKYCEWGFLPAIDGVDLVLWTTPGLHQAWATYQWDGYFNVTAGDHTVDFGVIRAGGTGQAYQVYGNHYYWRTGTTFTVEDAGVVI